MAEPCPDREKTDQNTPAEDLIAKLDVNPDTPAEDLVAKPNINPERTTPVVQQEETSSAAAGFGHRYPSPSHQPRERLGLNLLLLKLLVKKIT